MNHTLILGGIRSGKSDHAEHHAAQSGRPVTYVATATALDTEMAERIRRHQQRRPEHWGLLEEPRALGQAVRACAETAPCLLIDCMSLWLGNLLQTNTDALEAEIADFRQALSNYPGSAVIVSNEVGLTTVAMDPLSRQFTDRLGWLNQELAAQCHRVQLIAAGLPLTLKNEAPAAS